MAFIKKIWKNRQSEYPNRRKLLATGTENEFEVVRSEGMVIEEGDLLDAANLNDLETRIEKTVKEIDESLAQGTEQLTAISKTANAAMPKSSFVFDPETGTLDIYL